MEITVTWKVVSFKACIYMFSKRKHINTFNINKSPYIAVNFVVLLLCYSAHTFISYTDPNMVNFNHILKSRNVGNEPVTQWVHNAWYEWVCTVMSYGWSSWGVYNLVCVLHSHIFEVCNPPVIKGIILFVFDTTMSQLYHLQLQQVDSSSSSISLLHFIWWAPKSIISVQPQAMF